MVVTLIGYRGTGKSAVGRRLAERLGWVWCDSDTCLEDRSGQTIREIFESQGEPGFRRLEHDLIRDLLAKAADTPNVGTVLSVGGGAILDERTRQRICQAGPVVWLTAGVDTILQRLKADASTAARRPQLTQAGGRAEVEQLLQHRLPIYRSCAVLEVATDDRDIEAIVADILQELDRPSRQGAGA
jgi:shikimate kinase